MDPLSDDELSETLRKLEAQPAPKTLEARIFGSRTLRADNRWWKRTFSYSVRIPIPVLALTVLAFSALGAFALRTDRSTLSSRRTEGIEVSGSEHALIMQPMAPSNRASPAISTGDSHARPSKASAGDGRVTRLDNGTLSVPAGAVDRNLVTSTDPEYPPDAKRGGVQGIVKLRVRIGKDGRVTEATVISGKPVLTPAAVEAVKERVYRPTLLNGNPVAVISEVEVVFRLDVNLVSRLTQ